MNAVSIYHKQASCGSARACWQARGPAASCLIHQSWNLSTYEGRGKQSVREYHHNGQSCNTFTTSDSSFLNTTRQHSTHSRNCVRMKLRCNARRNTAAVRNLPLGNTDCYRLQYTWLHRVGRIAVIGYRAPQQLGHISLPHCCHWVSRPTATGTHLTAATAALLSLGIVPHSNWDTSHCRHCSIAVIGYRAPQQLGHISLPPLPHCCHWVSRPTATGTHLTAATAALLSLGIVPHSNWDTSHCRMRYLPLPTCLALTYFSMTYEKC
jgi:hypothetical protein